MALFGAGSTNACNRADARISPERATLATGLVPAAESCGDRDVFQKLCIKKPENVPNFRFDQVAAPYPDAAGCKAFDTGLTPAHPTTRVCLCDRCFALQQQCDALPACRAMLHCSLNTGCLSREACYLNNGSCRDVIDAWGNTGVASALLERLNGCALETECRMPADSGAPAPDGSSPGPADAGAD
jgi:hypothetical protein